jgi:hypothetical protein
MRRHAERLLKRSAEMVRTEARELSEGAERDLVCDVLLDIVRDGTFLPTGKPTPDRRLDTRHGRMKTHEFMGEHDSERFTIEPIDGLGTFDESLQPDRDIPQPCVLEEQPGATDTLACPASGSRGSIAGSK